MILSTQNLFSDAQAITASAVSENILDFGAIEDPVHAVAGGRAGRQIGASDVEIFAQVVEDFAALTSLEIEVQTAADEAFSSPTVTHRSGVVPAADLVAGKKFNLHRLAGDTGRYARLNYVVAGTNASAGKVTAGVIFADDSREV